MKFYRIWALIEREHAGRLPQSRADDGFDRCSLWVQLIVLGYAFGGKIKGATIAFVDQDQSVESRRVRADALTALPRVRKCLSAWWIMLRFLRALDDLKAGFVRGVIQVPYDFPPPFLSARPAAHRLQRRQHRSGNGERALLERIQQIVEQPERARHVQPRMDAPRCNSTLSRYIPISNTPSIFWQVPPHDGDLHRRDDRRRNHVHRRQVSRAATKRYLLSADSQNGIGSGGLLAPVRLKGLFAGMALTIMWRAPCGHPASVQDPVRGFFYLTLVVLVASIAMISFMFLAMVRVDDPLVPRAIFGVLNTLLFCFPSGAISPVEELSSVASMDVGYRPVHLYCSCAA